MPYCQKCGNKVDETMTFCPRCGASLKDQAYSAQAPIPPTYRRRNEKEEKNEKREKQEPEKGEQREKSQSGYVGFLIGGLVLILLGAFSLLNAFNSALNGAVFLLLVGVIIIVAAVYLAITARKRFPPPAT